MRLAILTFLLALPLLAACGGDEAAVETTATATGAAPPAVTDTGEGTGDADAIRFAEGHVLIEKRRGDPVSVFVEIAETAEQQQRGLMFRPSLLPDHGMIFVFDSEQTSGFWMKDTRIPLSIAFYGAKGEILKIVDMEPCEAEPCPTYEAGVPYRGALEVNKGAFRRWGVKPGDRIVLHRL